MNGKSDFEKYLTKVWQRPEAIVLVHEGRPGSLVTFGNNAVLVAQRLDKPLKRIDAHRTVFLRAGDLASLEAQGPEPLVYA